MLVLSSLVTSGQENIKVIDSLIRETQLRDSIINLYKSQSKTSTQEAKVLKHSGSIVLESNKSNSIFEFIFPSIIAIIVGLIALYGTIYTGKRQRKLSERQLKDQLTEAKKTVDAQIKSSKEILEKQIQSADKNAELMFRQNVLSDNRQNWINRLRDIISEMMAIVGHMALTKSVPYDDYKKLEQLITTAELMVNPEKDKDFVKALNNLHLDLLKATTEKGEPDDLWKSKDVVMKLAKKTLKTEWERVKKGE